MANADAITKLKENLKTNFNSTEFLRRSTVVIGKSDLRSDSDGERIRILQWNILAQGLVPTSQFAKCPSSVLNYERRRLSVKLELALHQADILCLEEVDLYSEMLDFLNETGVPYEGHFLPKPHSICLHSEGNHGPDGCAIFFRSDRFRCLDTKELQLITDNHDPGSQVALFVKLQSLARSNIAFHVVCTHLKAKKEFFSKRKLQGNVLLEEIKTRIGNENCFICGDFNADPDEQVMQDMANSTLGLSSVYQEASGGNEPEFTTWKMRGKSVEEAVEVCHTIDYIWYRREHVRPECVLEIPSKDEIGPLGLPCEIFPSDHMSLIADFTVFPTN